MAEVALMFGEHHRNAPDPGDTTAGIMSLPKMMCNGTKVPFSIAAFSKGEPRGAREMLNVQQDAL